MLDRNAAPRVLLMALWKFDTYYSGFAWLNLTGDLEARAWVLDATTVTPTIPSSPSGGSYSLVDTRDGSAVLTGGVAEWIGDSFKVNEPPDVALVVGVVYQERWSCTVDGQTVTLVRDAHASAFPMRDPLITSATLAGLIPSLARVPSGFTDWQVAIVAAHTEICTRLIASRRANLINPLQLAQPEQWLAAAMVFEGLRVFPEQAATFRARYENRMAALRLSFDTDGDGAVDESDRQINALDPAATARPRI